jgi:glycerol-3-phosphate acyltransferase PlsX
LLPGVTAPALAAVYPTALRRGRNADPFSLLLDIGATLDPSAEQLCSFAALGSVYARAISRNPRPRVALLSIDKDPSRSLPEITSAHALLHAAPGIDFVGTVEAVDIPKGEADVIVCGGFVGNVVIALLDGVNELVVDLARYGQKQRLLWRAGLAMLSGGVNQLKQLTDWEHPRSGARAIQNACRVAAKAVAADLATGFAELHKEQALHAVESAG